MKRIVRMIAALPDSINVSVHVSASYRGLSGMFFSEIPLYNLSGFQWHFNVQELER